MKLAGIAGKARGRLGSMVYKSVNGEQIVSQYQPSVSNPNTTAQVNQRARFKLMSQVAAAVSGEIAIPKSGLTSSRNAFVKKNFALSSINEDAANINLEQLQFTNGNVAVPPVVAARGGEGINVALSAAADVSRVCYLVYRTNAQQQLQFVSSTIAETAGADGTFPATLDAAEGELIVYAYGMRDTDAAASARYGNYNVQDGTALASLIVARTLSTADYTLTRTSGTTVAAGTNQHILTIVNGNVNVSVTVTGDTVVSLGNNQYSVEDGSFVTVNATASGNGEQVAGIYVDNSELITAVPHSISVLSDTTVTIVSLSMKALVMPSEEEYEGASLPSNATGLTFPINFQNMRDAMSYLNNCVKGIILNLGPCLEMSRFVYIGCEGNFKLDLDASDLSQINNAGGIKDIAIGLIGRMIHISYP